MRNQLSYVKPSHPEHMYPGASPVYTYCNVTCLTLAHLVTLISKSLKLGLKTYVLWFKKGCCVIMKFTRFRIQNRV